MKNQLYSTGIIDKKVSVFLNKKNYSFIIVAVKIKQIQGGPRHSFPISLDNGYPATLKNRMISIIQPGRIQFSLSGFFYTVAHPARFLPLEKSGIRLDNGYTKGRFIGYPVQFQTSSFSKSESKTLISEKKFSPNFASQGQKVTM